MLLLNESGLILPFNMAFNMVNQFVRKIVYLWFSNCQFATQRQSVVMITHQWRKIVLGFLGNGLSLWFTSVQNNQILTSCWSQNDYSTLHSCHNSFQRVFICYVAEHSIWSLEPGVRGPLMRTRKQESAKIQVDGLYLDGYYF